ncbi:Nip1p [Saccharomyces cerevisiae YJM1388]|nr:Nip1p [Saccharomyces cerevisiae YJM1388]
MSRFFSSNYEYDVASSSSEEDLLSSSEEDLLSSSSSESELDQESDDSFFNESESESEADVDSDDSDAKPYGPDWFKKSEFRKQGGGSNKFLKSSNYDSSDEESDEEDGKKVVKSAKEKLLDEMQDVYNKISQAENSDDWLTISNEFDLISRLLVRAQQQNWGTPNIFIKVVAQVEDAVNNTQQADLKNKAVARAYNTTKQRVKKVSRENEDSMAKFRNDPESFDKEPTADLDISANGFTISSSQGNDQAVQEDFFTRLQTIIDSRGKKTVNQQSLISTLEELLTVAEKPYEFIMAYLTLIPSRFDASANLSYQPIDQWKSSFNDISKLLSILDQTIDTYQVNEFADPIDFIEDEPKEDSDGVKRILGSIFSFVERLDDEFMKSLLNIDPHSSDYLIRLRDEQSIYNLILRTQLYFEATLKDEHDLERALTRPFVKRLDHIYYKSENLIKIMETAAWNIIPAQYKSKFTSKDQLDSADYVDNLIDGLSTILSKQNNIAVQKRAILYNIYYTALNKDFQTAKDMLLTSQVQTNINQFDSSLQILFNRVVVQLGLSAFKLCLIEECHQILNDLLSSSHLREILGQQSLHRISINSSNNASADERARQCLPYHQHINLDLIDVVFLTCSLLIEIPRMTAFYSGIKVKRIPYSPKSIRRSLEHYDKLSFQGPPETLRDYVLFAAKSMQKGNWRDSVKYLREIKSLALLPNMETVLNSLTERVQVESLKTYFFSFKRFYSSFSVAKLAELFDLPENKVVEVLQSVIAELEIPAKLNDEKTIFVVEKGDEITKLEEAMVKLNKEYKIAKERLNPPSNRR